MPHYNFFFAHSLEKVFPDQHPAPLRGGKIAGLKGENLALQMVYRQEDPNSSSYSQTFQVSLDGFPGPTRIRTVELVPSQYPCTPKRDLGYLQTTPGLFPDLLLPSSGQIRPVEGQFRSLWIDFETKDVPAGVYRIHCRVAADKTIRLGNGQTRQTGPEFDWEETIELEVYAAELPEQDLIHTEWFHADCLADYYRVSVFSNEHWQILENFIAFAGRRCGINTLLTPVFTPPLDTEVGGERTTVQLVGVKKEGNHYSFDFSRLIRWCALCKKSGITHLEISHLFTQWGAEFTPKIMAEEEGREQRIFGWDVKANSKEYRTFLEALIPPLLSCLQNEGYDKDHLFFHVSDEPEEQHLDSYLQAKSQVEDLLEGYTIMDALSSYEFYKRGVVSHPVPASDAIQPFLTHQVPDLWVYYCVAQGRDVPNRFFAMPSARNRIMGVLMYLHQIKGFLHWGFNFYNSQFSKDHINPFLTTDCGMAFPSGDAFLVYPAPDGTPYSSLRNEIQMQAFQDLRVLRYMENRIGREETVRLVLGEEEELFSFTNYPQYPDYFVELRQRVHDKIRQLT